MRNPVNLSIENCRRISQSLPVVCRLTLDSSCACLQYIASAWNHDGDPVELLQINESVSRFRQTLKENPHFLQDKVRQYFKVTETHCWESLCVYVLSS